MKHIHIILFALCSFCCITGLQAQSEQLKANIQEFIKDKKARIGVGIILNGKDTVTVNNEDRYPMMSVFKFHQALAVLNYLQQNNLSLDTRIRIEKEDIIENTYSPLRDKYPQGNVSLSISELLKYTIQLSDNIACDVLFKYIGGPSVADKYIRSLGVQQFSIVITEDDMHQDLSACYLNWSTPLEAARLLDILLTRSLFKNEYQEFLKNIMIECETGKDRLPQPLLKTDAVIGHKTGTSDQNAKGQFIGTNDIGFVLLPNGSRYTVAVFIKDSNESMETNAKIIADISEAIYKYFTESNN